MTQTTLHGSGGIDTLLGLWFSLTVLSVGYMAYEQFHTGNDRPKMHRFNWLLYTLYTGPFSVLVYWLLRRGATQAPWKRALESTVHCGAGQLTGMLLAAVIAAGLGVAGEWELAAEYLAGLFVSLFLFKALRREAGSYWQAVRDSWFSETLAMNAMMAGQIPVMAKLMSLDMRAMQPTSVLFWGTMSFSFMVGSLTTYPLMRWLVNSQGATERVRQHSWRKLAALLLTLAALAGGVGLARIAAVSPISPGHGHGL